MQRFNTYQTAPVPSGGSDWQAEINGGGQTEARSVGDAHSWQSPEGSEYVTLPGGQMMPMGNMPGIRTNLPEDVIQNPLSVEEAHNGSIKAMLARNEGNYVVATFLVGTQGTVSWEGSSMTWAMTSSPFTSRGGAVYRDGYLRLEVYRILRYPPPGDVRGHAEAERPLEPGVKDYK